MQRNNPSKRDILHFVATLGQLSLPSVRGRYMSTSFGWEGKDMYGSFR